MVGEWVYSCLLQNWAIEVSKNEVTSHNFQHFHGKWVCMEFWYFFFKIK